MPSSDAVGTHTLPASVSPGAADPSAAGPMPAAYAASLARTRFAVVSKASVCVTRQVVRCPANALSATV